MGARDDKQESIADDARSRFRALRFGMTNEGNRGRRRVSLAKKMQFVGDTRQSVQA